MFSNETVPVLSQTFGPGTMRELAINGRQTFYDCSARGKADDEMALIQRQILILLARIKTMGA
jgi:hypothetical protein